MIYQLSRERASPSAWSWSAGGGTASLPTVIDVLDPRCFNYSEQMRYREAVLTQRGKNNQEETLQRPSSGWEKRFWDEVSRALRQAAMKNLCYEFVTGGGTWMGVFEEGSTINRVNKNDLISASSRCSAKVMETMWPLIRESWESLKDKSGDCEFQKNGQSQIPTLSKVLECALSLKENNSRGILDKEGEFDKLSEKVYSKWTEFDWRTVSEKVTVEIELKKDWGGGRLYSSSCVSAEIKR